MARRRARIRALARDTATSIERLAPLGPPPLRSHADLDRRRRADADPADRRRVRRLLARVLPGLPRRSPPAAEAPIRRTATRSAATRTTSSGRGPAAGRHRSVPGRGRRPLPRAGLHPVHAGLRWTGLVGRGWSRLPRVGDCIYAQPRSSDRRLTGSAGLGRDLRVRLLRRPRPDGGRTDGHRVEPLQVGPRAETLEELARLCCPRWRLRRIGQAARPAASCQRAASKNCSRRRELSRPSRPDAPRLAGPRAPGPAVHDGLERL